MARRINYLHYLSNLKENELLYKFFKAQVESPQKGDWIVTVKEDIKNIGMDVDIDKLRKVKKYKFKKNVKKYVYKAAFEYLLLKALPTNHSKMANLKYEKFELQSYLKNENLKRNDPQQYFKFRTRMEDFADNFKNGANSIACPLCSMEDDNLESYIDSQQHFFSCRVIGAAVPEISKIGIKQIYSTKTFNHQEVKILLQALEKRKNFMDSI